MPRRQPYSYVKKHDQDRPAYVQRNGDKVFRLVACLASECQSSIPVRETDIEAGFRILCGTCQHELVDGNSTPLYDYDLVVDKKTVGSGTFLVDHGQHVRESPAYKYCIVCYTMKPLEAFSRHKARESRRQGECKSCKTTYNSIKNSTRIPDQHREASQRRRILGLLVPGTAKISRDEILQKFGHKCFKCDVAITKDNEALDHTLPLRLLWPLTTENATLLCGTCNGQKSGRWPSEFYDGYELRKLAVLTNIPYDELSGQPFVNPEAIEMIQKDPDGFLAEWIHEPDELKILWRRVKDIARIDVFKNATNVPSYLLDEP